MKSHRIFCFASSILFACLIQAAAAETVTLAVPGPGTLSYLPVYLAKAIAADKSEGLDLKLRFVAGGPLALQDLADRNCDFVAVGLPAMADVRAEGDDVIAIGQLSQAAMYAFMLRSDLKKQVSKVAQLKGRKIGVTSSTSRNRSMGHMMMEYVLGRAGVKGSEVQFVSAGQSRESQSAALSSATVDAIMGDEPFASELVARGVAVRLADLYSPAQSREMLGGPIVHAALGTRKEVWEKYPDSVRKILRMYDRTLQWMAQHTPEEIVAKLSDQPGFSIEKSKVLVEVMQRNQGMFPLQTLWDPQAVSTTEDFFHETSGNQLGRNLQFADWVISVK